VYGHGAVSGAFHANIEHHSDCLLFLSASETIKGVGRDVEDAGDAIDDAVDDE